MTSFTSIANLDCTCTVETGGDWRARRRLRAAAGWWPALAGCATALFGPRGRTKQGSQSHSHSKEMEKGQVGEVVDRDLNSIKKCVHEFYSRIDNVKTTLRIKQLPTGNWS